MWLLRGVCVFTVRLSNIWLLNLSKLNETLGVVSALSAVCVCVLTGVPSAVESEAQGGRAAVQGGPEH